MRTKTKEEIPDSPYDGGFAGSPKLEQPKVFLQTLELIKNITNMIKEEAQALYLKIKGDEHKGFNIKEHFNVPKPNTIIGHMLPFQNTLYKVCQEVLSIILGLQNESNAKISVSICLVAETNDESEPLSAYAPYVSYSNATDIDLKFGTKLSFIVKKNESDGYFFPKRQESDFKVTVKWSVDGGQLTTPESVTVKREKKYHGGIPLSERMIRQIDYIVDAGGEAKIQTSNDYCGKKEYIYTRNSNETNEKFDDGTQYFWDPKTQKSIKQFPCKNSAIPNSAIQHRSQWIAVPLECEISDGHKKRFGYLQVVGYMQDGNETTFLGVGEDDPKMKLIVEILKCYAQCIVLSNKVESIKNINIIPAQLKFGE